MPLRAGAYPKPFALWDEYRDTCAYYIKFVGRFPMGTALQKYNNLMIVITHLRHYFLINPHC